MKLIEADALKNAFNAFYGGVGHAAIAAWIINDAPTVDAVEVVRCQNCIHAEPFDRHCELNRSAYMHCKLLRGEEVQYVWHKYKKYYKDYSVVDRDGFCDEGEPLNGEVDGDSNG